MDKSNASHTKMEKQLDKISLILMVVGVVTTVCLVFFFVELFHRRGDATQATVYSAQQIGQTDKSLLISWSSSDASLEFNVKCAENTGAEVTEVRTRHPFAAIHDLEPDKEYKVTIIPIDENGEQEPYELDCRTSPYCNVTSVNVEEVDGSSATVSWTYEGRDTGFTVIAYALDQNRKRHLTSAPISVPAGAETKQCRLTGLLSELHYTVCVMPDTKYAGVAKSDFTTLRNSESYNNVSIIRFVACENQSRNQVMVRVAYQLAANSPYKTSMILSGTIDPFEDVGLTVYITDPDGNLISEFLTPNIIRDQIGTGQILYQSLMTEFTSPEKEGSYKLLAALENVTVARSSFTVVG